MTQTPRPTETTPLPVLPARRAAPAVTDDLVSDLRRFHFAPAGEFPPVAGCLPAALYDARRSSWAAAKYPLLLAPPESDEEASCLPLPDLLSRAAPRDSQAAAGEIPPDRLAELARRVRRLTAGQRAPVDARQLLGQACGALVDEAGGAGGSLATGVEALMASIPAGTSLLPFSPQTPLHLLMHAATSRLLPPRSAFREETRGLATRAEELLAADRQRRPESRTSGAVDSALGELGSRYVDPSALAGVLDARSGGSTLSSEREQRLEDALATLKAYLDGEADPALTLAHDGEHGVPALETLESGKTVTGRGWHIERHEDPCAAAAEIFDREAEKLARVLRAVRRIRLETAGRYDPERQEPWLERFDWQAFSRRELLLLPPVVALVAADRVAGPGMVSLSRLLRSGRPVQVVVALAPAANPDSRDAGAAREGQPAAELSGFRFEPAYLGLSHREAFVQQTSATEPGHMIRGYHRALAATHTGLHVVLSGNELAGAAAEGPALDAEARAAAALQARAHPLFRYDPDLGSSWAERLDFSHNPDAEIDWPARELEAVRENGDRETLTLAFTFADVALLDPAHGHHFYPVPAGLPESELVPVAEQSRAPARDEPEAIPYIWAVDASSRLVRLAISRPLAFACRDRLDFWRILQELSGVRSEHVRRAEVRLREELEQQAAREREALEERHAQELESVRQDAARQIVDRLTSALFEVDVAAFVAPDEPAVAAPLAGLRGRGVDEVAAALLEIVESGSLDEVEAGAGGEGVDRLASDLLGLVADDAGESR